MHPTTSIESDKNFGQRCLQNASNKGGDNKKKINSNLLLYLHGGQWAKFLILSDHQYFQHCDFSLERTLKKSVAKPTHGSTNTSFVLHL